MLTEQSGVGREIRLILGYVIPRLSWGKFMLRLQINIYQFCFFVRVSRVEKMNAETPTRIRLSWAADFLGIVLEFPRGESRNLGKRLAELCTKHSQEA